MPLQHFFAKLLPPRATFAEDMTDDEVKVMNEHQAYTQGHLDAGRVQLYGPVRDPRGIFGIAILAVENEAEARAIMDKDPSVAGGLNTYELHPMRLGGARAPA
jgi:uncharacterized protein YciI